MTPTFPGMKAYLENPSLWSEVHSWLIVELARRRNPPQIPLNPALKLAIDYTHQPVPPLKESDFQWAQSLRES